MKTTSIKCCQHIKQLKAGFGLYGLFIIIGFLLYACDPGLVYEKNQTTDAQAWKASEPVTIDFFIDDTLNPMNLYVNIRHNTNYEKSNLYLFVETRYPNNYYTVDTLEFILAEPSGLWLGSGLGKIKSMQVLIARGVRFPMTGNYSMRFEQAMRTDALAGIEDIGLRIEKMQGR